MLCQQLVCLFVCLFFLQRMVLFTFKRSVQSLLWSFRVLSQVSVNKYCLLCYKVVLPKLMMKLTLKNSKLFEIDTVRSLKYDWSICYFWILQPKRLRNADGFVNVLGGNHDVFFCSLRADACISAEQKRRLVFWGPCRASSVLVIF